jgi:hypothetical protein
MNIFVLSRCPRIAARLHCDKHVVKMILETAQLLYTAHHVVGTPDLPEGAYKKTHANHPCALWVRESRANYLWLVELGWWLCKEYQYRYGGGKVHKTERHILWLKSCVPFLPDVPATPFRLAMPDPYKCDDPVQAYQAYYRENKLKVRGIVAYTRRERPVFLLAN